MTWYDAASLLLKGGRRTPEARRFLKKQQMAKNISVTENKKIYFEKTVGITSASSYFKTQVLES